MDVPDKKVIFIDIDGTLLQGGEPVVGAAEAVHELCRRGYTIRYLTNITSRSPDALQEQLSSSGFPCDGEVVHTPLVSCLAYLDSRGVTDSLYVLVPSPLEPYFVGFEKDSDKPKYLVIADVEDRFSYAEVNRLFLFLESGAEMLAFHKNMYWYNKGVKQIDSGAYITALEAASGKQATLLGKPSNHFFETAIELAGCRREEVVVVGDDVLTDISGARRMGLASVLVQTGKYKDNLGKYDVEADAVVPSVCELPELLKNKRGSW